jgi:hypothetical protein
MKKYLSLVPFVLLLAYWIFQYFNNKHQISTLHYGTKANAFRQKHFVPIIEDDMKPDRYDAAILGLRWQARRELPSDREVLHVWKIVTPLSDTAGLYQEKDAFRKKYNDSLYYQLNINSEITGDTIAKRSGKLFFYERAGLLEQELNDRQIDSVAKNWGILYLKRLQ